MSAAREVLADSRLPELEATVFSFLCRHSGTLKLQATMDDLMQLIQQVCWPLCAMQHSRNASGNEEGQQAS